MFESASTEVSGLHAKFTSILDAEDIISRQATSNGRLLNGYTRVSVLKVLLV